MRWAGKKPASHLRDIIRRKRRCWWPVECDKCQDRIWLEPVRFVQISISRKLFLCYACAFTANDFIEYALKKPIGYVSIPDGLFNNINYTVTSNGQLKFGFRI